jgi:hypothetical protein
VSDKSKGFYPSLVTTVWTDDYKKLNEDFRAVKAALKNVAEAYSGGCSHCGCNLPQAAEAAVKLLATLEPAPGETK